MPQVTFYASAEQEMLDAAKYYERKSLSAKAAFLNAIDRFEGQILQFPEAGKKIHGEIRCRFLTSYPYAMCYISEPDGHIRIIAVAHMKRKPLYWLGRER